MTGLQLGRARVFVSPGATDMRKQINGLALIVEQQMNLNPFAQALFVFCNAQRRILKALYWDRTGFCMWTKRLEQQRFPWPRNCSEVSQQIDEQQLGMLAARGGLLERASGAILHESQLKPLRLPHCAC